MSTATTSRPSARERLLAAADELFYAEGIHTVGIDRVIEHAGVAKASLYKCFGSKDELIAAYLEQRADQLISRIQAAADAHRDPRRRLLAVFDQQAERLSKPGYNGCPFARAAAESPVDGVAREANRLYRERLVELLTELARDAAVKRPAELARQLQLLYDGAANAGRYDTARTAVTAKSAAGALFDAALA